MTRFKSKTLVIPQFVAGEHGLFGGHKSEDIRTFLQDYKIHKILLQYSVVFFCHLSLERFCRILMRDFSENILLKILDSN